MKKSRNYSLIDQLFINIDNSVKTLTSAQNIPNRPSPANKVTNSTTPTQAEEQHTSGLMRINHTGEVCAQALYQGQALTAKLPQVRQAMEHAAQEEVDHLVWCQQRLTELGSHASYTNPLWYALSFSLGAAAGLAGDKWSLGFVAATEEQVCKHLDSHLKQLPTNDHKSHAILKQMKIDEAQHATTALAAGGADLPRSIKTMMRLVAKAMTITTYRI